MPSKRILSTLRRTIRAATKSRFVEMFGDFEPSVPISEACIEFVDGDRIESKDQSESGIRLIPVDFPKH